MSNPYFDPTIQDQYYDTGGTMPKKPGPNIDWSGVASGIAGLGLNAYAMANQGNRRLNQGIAPSQYDLNSAPAYTAGNAQYEASTAKSQGATGGEIASATGQGAATGASIGSVIPGIGTAVGAAVGGVVGAASSLIGGGARAARQRKEREAALRRVAGAQQQYNAQDVAFRNQQNQMQEYYRRMNPYNREYAVNQTHF